MLSKVVLALMQLGIVLAGIWIMLGPLRQPVKRVGVLALRLLGFLLLVLELALAGLLALVQLLRKGRKS